MAASRKSLSLFKIERPRIPVLGQSGLIGLVCGYIEDLHDAFKILRFRSPFARVGPKRRRPRFVEVVPV